jgi:hypothetical protein
MKASKTYKISLYFFFQNITFHGVLCRFQRVWPNMIISAKKKDYLHYRQLLIKELNIFSFHFAHNKTLKGPLKKLWEDPLDLVFFR